MSACFVSEVLKNYEIKFDMGSTLKIFQVV
jgi:hypothetical protein